LLVSAVLAAPLLAKVLFSPPDRGAYFWMHFGKEARLRVLVRVEGEALAIDANGDGRFSTSEYYSSWKNCRDLAIRDPDGRTSYLVTGVGYYEDGTPAERHWMVSVTVQGPLTFRQYCDVGVSSFRAWAPVAHFNGPLTVQLSQSQGKIPEHLKLKHGSRPSELTAIVATVNRDRGCWTVVRTHETNKNAEWFKGAVPVVDIEFPPRQAGQPYVKQRFALRETC